MPDSEYVICARCGETPLRSKALEFGSGRWLCFPHALEYAQEMGDPWLKAEIRHALAEAGWKGKEWRE